MKLRKIEKEWIRIHGKQFFQICFSITSEKGAQKEKNLLPESFLSELTPFRRRLGVEDTNLKLQKFSPFLKPGVSSPLKTKKKKKKKDVCLG